MNKLMIGVFLAGALGANAQVALKDAYKGKFRIGAAINERQVLGEDVRGVKLIQTQFNSITPENILKWEHVHPQPDKYDFAIPDRYVEFGEKNHMFIIGHTLIWHNQTPKWVFQDEQGNPVSRDVLLARMKEHIYKVVGRYKGRIKGWDVVNEALNEDGTLRQSLWQKIIGDDYIEKAFQFAHEADPSAELYYNDYSLENEPKRTGALALVKQMKDEGIAVHAVGLQGHDKLDWPTVEQQDATITAFKALGMKVNITELDITVLPSPARQQDAEVTARAVSSPELNPYTSGLPTYVQESLAKRYAELFAVFAKHSDVIERVTFWGVTDGDSWRNNWPATGRTDYPLLFDRDGKAKPAYDAVVRAGQPESAKK